MSKFTFQWNSVPKLTLGAEVHRLVPKLFRAEVTRVEHRLPPIEPENRFQVQFWISEFLNRNLDLDSHEKTFDPMIIFYATKACQDEKWY